MGFFPLASRVINAGIALDIVRHNLGAGTSSRKGSDPYNKTDSTIVAPAQQVAPNPINFGYSPYRGIFAIKQDVNQYLQFQFNPEEISDSKEVTYEDRLRLGFDNADYIWVNGGARTVSFTLKLDATESSRVRHLGKSGNPVPTGNDLLTHNPEVGVLGQVQFLQSLQRPFEPGQLSPRFIRANAQPSNQFVTPPEVIFVYGVMYLEGVLSSLSVTYTGWNSKLVPVQAECAIVFRVQEGKVLQINPQVTALAGSI